MAFNGLGMNLGNLSRLSPALTRSISPESYHRRKGQGGHGDRGQRSQLRPGTWARAGR